MNKIDVVIYSCDRACQLDLLLKSLEDNFIENINNITILYKASNKEYLKGYEKIQSYEFSHKKLYYLINWKPELNFQSQLKELIRVNTVHINSRYFLGLCDDDVFIRKVEKNELNELLLEFDKLSNGNAISLKSGLHITRHYPDIVVKHPDFIEKERFLKWNWKTQPAPTDWGYPTCINSFIYSYYYYDNILSKINFTYPTDLEAACNTARNMFNSIMIGTKKLAILNIPTNRIQTLNDTPYGLNNNYSLNELNSLFLKNYVISTENLYNLTVDRPNLDVPFKFIERC